MTLVSLFKTKNISLHCNSCQSPLKENFAFCIVDTTNRSVYVWRISCKKHIGINQKNIEENTNAEFVNNGFFLKKMINCDIDGLFKKIVEL